MTGLSGTVTNVKLRLNNTAAASNSSRVACVYAVADTSWTETGITWNTAPTVGASLGCVNGAQAAGWIEYDLGTPFSGNGTYAFAVFENVSTSVIYHSKEGTSAPELVVTTSGAPSDNVSNLQTATTYDALGRTTSTTDPSGTLTSFGYDRLGRLTSTTENYVDGTASGASGDDDVVSRFGYNAAGELTGYCSGKQVFVGGCDENNPSNAQAWRYAFDDAGRMARQTPPVNATATALVNRLWEYDTGGRLKKVCDGPSSITSCTSAAVLRTFESTYDDVGRLIKTDTKSGPSTTLASRTETTYLGDGAPSQTKYSTGTTPTVVDTIDYAYDAAGRQTKLLRGATVLSERAFNPDGTLQWRKDGDNAALGQSGFTYDWAQRLRTVDLPDTQFSTAVPSFSWRLDGLIGGRTWSGSAATFAYDAAKRVTSLSKGSLSFSQAYDRDGNVTSEGRSLTGVTGDPGTGTQSFSYDGLGRVTGSSGLASGSRTYTYDRDGNRLTKVEGGSTYTYTYDRTDQLINVLKTGGSTQSFGYDAFGNMTIDAQSGLTITNMAYDLDDRLTAIDASGGTANDASFTLDALGRFRTRVIAAGTETYSYVEGSETVARIAGPGGTNTDSIVSPAGDRLGVRVGTTVNWFLPDLHGSLAGSLDAAETTVVNALRYDAWGQTISTGTAGGTRVGDKAWKYQGRLDVSPDGLATPLYDMSARFYMPGTGTFSQLDTYAGSAQNPLSMNRFLYAHSNPATLTDPTGHLICEGDCDGTPTKAEIDATRDAVIKNVSNAKEKEKERRQRKEKQKQGGSKPTAVAPLLSVPEPQKNALLAALAVAIAVTGMPEACSASDSPEECLGKTKPKDLCDLMDPLGLSPTGGCQPSVVFNSGEVSRPRNRTSAILSSNDGWIVQPKPTTSWSGCGAAFLGPISGCAGTSLGNGLFAKGNQVGAAVEEENAGWPPSGSELSGWGQHAKRALAKKLAEIARAARPIARGVSRDGGRWWEYRDVHGDKKLVVEHPDGSVHAGPPKDQSLHHEGGPPKFYDPKGPGHLGHVGDD